MLRFMGLSSTMSVRKPPDDDRENDSLAARLRERDGTGDDDVMKSGGATEGGLSGYTDVGLHGGVIGGTG